MGDVWIFTQDVGGTNGILPVISKLQRSAIPFEVFAEGLGTKLLKQSGILFSSSELAEERLVLVSPRVVLTTTCSKAGRKMMRFVQEERTWTSTFALQDFWGAKLGSKPWCDPKWRPDWICVGDQIDAEITLQVWNGYTKHQVHVTGWPALDRYASYDIEAAKNRVQRVLGKKMPVVFYGIENVKGAGEACHDFIEAVNEIGRKIYLVVKMHPDTLNTVPEEIPICKEALKKFKSGMLVHGVPKGLDLHSLIAGADVVVAMYSTILIEAAVLRNQVISVLYPEIGMARFREETGLDEFPLAALGCSAKATSWDELRQLLEESFDNALDLQQAQREAFKLDGQNARRVAELIQSAWFE